MIIQYLSEGFALGLSLSLTCVSTCGPIYTSFLLQRKSDLWQSVIIILKLSGARFISYALFGIGAGYLGRSIGEINRSWFTVAAYFLFSTFLIISAFRTHSREKGCQMAKWSRFADNPFILGFVTGLNFCPAFLITVTRAVDISGPFSGAIVFMAFFFGSNLPLIFFAIFGVMGNKKVFRIIGMISAVLVGIFFISKASITTVKLINQEKELKAGFEDNTIINVFDSTDAFLLTKDTVLFLPVKEHFQKKRYGKISFISDTTEFPDSGYVFIDPKWPEEDDKDFKKFKRSGCFMIILPYFDDSAGYSEDYIKQISVFLEKYYFKLNKEEGSLFNMLNLHITPKNKK